MSIEVCTDCGSRFDTDYYDECPHCFNVEDESEPHDYPDRF